MKNVFQLFLVLVFCIAAQPGLVAQETLEKPKSKKTESQKQSDDKDSDSKDRDQGDKDVPQADGKNQDQKAKEPKAKKQDKDKPKAKKDEPRRRTRGSGLFFGGSKSLSKKNPAFVGVFKPVIASMDPATIRVYANGKQVALGTVVDSDGLILTKASEIGKNLTCRIGKKNYSAKVLGVHKETDLALLKIKADSLNQVQWAAEPTPPMGNWVASPKATRDGTPAIGIISVTKARKIPPSSPFIGIQMENVKEGVKITEVIGKSPALAAGLKVDDVVYQIEDLKVKTNFELGRKIRTFGIGDRLTLKILRDGRKMTVRVTLAERDKISPASERSNQQNSMGSRLSRRRRDFPMAFQHDSMLNSTYCGGPIVDLSGKVIGINIARDGRVSSLALPVETVLPILADLKEGKLAPEVVNREKIAAIESELKELVESIGTLPERKSVLSMRFNSERARKEELEKTIKSLQERLEGVTKREQKYKAKLDDVHGRLRSSQKVKEQLEKRLESLKAGNS